MLCDVCKCNDAAVFLTQIVDGKMQKVNLCEGCSKEKGVQDPTGFALADLLLGIGAAEEMYRNGLTVVTVATRRTNPSALNPAVKSLNYLNNVMARIEANQANADEALMLNDEGNVAECTADNVFIVKHGQICTPPITAGALRGITRSVVFEIAAETGIKVVEADITRHDVFVADEAFLTGTAAEIIPLIKADGREIGTGKPGPITTRMIARFRELTRETGTPIYS